MRTNKKQMVVTQRQTHQKKIASLATQGKVYSALKLARGWKMETDPARRLVDQWRAVVEMENHPEVFRGAPVGFYEQILKRAAGETAAAVHRAFKTGDATGFFLRMLKATKKPREAVRDELRVAVLANMVPRQKVVEVVRRKPVVVKLGNESGGGKTAKEIASEVIAKTIGRKATASQHESAAHAVNRLKRDYSKASDR